MRVLQLVSYHHGDFQLKAVQCIQNISKKPYSANVCQDSNDNEIRIPLCTELTVDIHWLLKVKTKLIVD